MNEVDNNENIQILFIGNYKHHIKNNNYLINMYSLYKTIKNKELNKKEICIPMYKQEDIFTFNELNDFINKNEEVSNTIEFIKKSIEIKKLFDEDKEFNAFLNKIMNLVNDNKRVYEIFVFKPKHDNENVYKTAINDIIRTCNNVNIDFFKELRNILSKIPGIEQVSRSTNNSTNWKVQVENYLDNQKILFKDMKKRFRDRLKETEKIQSKYNKYYRLYERYDLIMPDFKKQQQTKNKNPNPSYRQGSYGQGSYGQGSYGQGLYGQGLYN